MTEHQALIRRTGRFASIDTGLDLRTLVIEADLDLAGGRINIVLIGTVADLLKGIAHNPRSGGANGFEILYPLSPKLAGNDTGWKIALDRGLDIFQQYELNDAFSFANRLQQFRSVKAFEVIYLNTVKS